ncbi:MAG: universal stress protein [Bacteroidales bacterium]|nr:universal stress protein [Bacteroidales bacterium]
MRPILVPHDFTEVGAYALEHAYMIGKTHNNPISLIHIVSKTDEIEPAKAKLQAIADDFKKQKGNVEITAEVRKGDLDKEIYKYGTEVNAHLAVMGTHGIKNLKKAIKIVEKFVTIPFILVQNPPIYGEYDRILIPIDADKSSRIRVQWVKYLNTLFESKVYIISYKDSDGFSRKAIQNTITFAENMFNDCLIDYDIKYLESKKNFSDEMYKYANEAECDLVIFMTDQYKSYIKDIKNPENEEMAAKIPAMCVNKRIDIIKLGGFN